MPSPRVFVVMPFRVKTARPATASEPEVQIDFDLVFERLLRPALLAAGCQPFRADEEAAAGDIRTDMFFELVTADVVLADISIHNANVFYELGVRHGVAPRGVLMVHGGWSQRPFDIAPDRTLDYAGALFAVGRERTPAWAAALDAEVHKLSRWVAGALATDHQTVASPVYKEVVGLKPADWSGVQTARFKYFTGVLDDWMRRVAVARAAGNAGDILTLADDAPTRYHHDTLRLAAARALIDLERFQAAEQVLAELCANGSASVEAQCLYGLVLGRLSRHAEAEAHLRKLAAAHQHDPEAQGQLGRLHKDTWRLKWESVPEAHIRVPLAARTAAMAAQAVRCYSKALRHDLRAYYAGINVVGLVKLLEHVARAGGTPCPAHGVEEVDVLAAIVARVAAQSRESARERGDGAEAAWAGATLGELALLGLTSGDACGCYCEATAEPGVTWFHLGSMLQQLELYTALDFAPERVQPCIEAVRGALEHTRRPQPVEGRVLLFSGHMVDAPGRTPPRFPASKVEQVSAALARVLDAWRVGPGDVAICGGACGGDILFAELCRARGAEIELYLALPRGEVMASSVRVGGGDWEQRFCDLAASNAVHYQHERIGRAAVPSEAFARNNRWMLDVARTRVTPERIHALLLWDERDSADGEGGTLHFKRAIEQLGTRLEIVNPLAL